MRTMVCLVVLLPLLSACAAAERTVPAGTATSTVAASTVPTPASPSGSFTPPAPEPCPVEAVLCETAASIQVALAAADFAAIEAISGPSSYTCPGGTPGGLGGPYPLCDSAIAGESRTGFPVHHFNSEGVVESSLLPALRSGIVRAVNGVAGPYADEPRIIGIHCPLEGGLPDCRGQVVVYFEGAPHIGIQADGESFKIGWLQFGNFAESPSVFVHGGDLTFAHDTVRPGHFFRWRTPNTPDPGNLARERWLLAPPKISGLDVTPDAGTCPVTLRLSAPAAASLVDPKGEAIVAAHVFKGVVAIDTTTEDRNTPREVIPALRIPGTDEYEITLQPSMLNGTLCSPGIVTVIAGGALGWLSTGYRVEP